MMLLQLMYLLSSIFVTIIGCTCLGVGLLLIIKFAAMLTDSDHVGWQCFLMISLGAVIILGGLLLIA